MINIPQISSIENALLIFHSNYEIGNNEIITLFGKISHTIVAKLKNMARDEMYAQNMNLYNSKRVNTKIAFEVWGIDIDDLEKRHKKLQELGLVS